MKRTLKPYYMVIEPFFRETVYIYIKNRGLIKIFTFFTVGIHGETKIRPDNTARLR